MKKFMIQHFCPPAEMKAMMTKSPEEMQSVMQQRQVWMQDCGEMMLDTWAPLMNGTRLTPWSVGGADEWSVSWYMMMQAESREAVIEKLHTSPLMKDGASWYVDVYEIKAMG